jgi:hypothetical protein
MPAGIWWDSSGTVLRVIADQTSTRRFIANLQIANGLEHKALDTVVLAMADFG